MATISETRATLRISSDDLEPDDISNHLGVQPSFSQKKGEVVVGKNGREREAKFGMWRLEAPDESPGDLNAQISNILGSLSNNLDTWEYLKDNYEIDLFCGLFMSEEMEGIDISPINLRKLGERHIEIGLDIYAPDQTEN